MELRDSSLILSTPAAPIDLRLAVVSHVVHYQVRRKLHAYAPYAREVEVWADLFREVVIAAPFRNSVPPGDCAPLDRQNITIVPQREEGGTTLGAKVALAARLPGMVWRLTRTLRAADAVHVRCPGNLGFLGAAIAPLVSKRLIAKYAGQWNAYPGEALTCRWQKALLRSRWWRGPVTVYGEWPGQPRHVIPFFTSVLTAEHIARARAACQREWTNPLQVLYVGRLSQSKNVDTLLRALACAVQDGADLQCTVAGDGEELPMLESLRGRLGLERRVEFLGGVSFERVIQCLERSHILVLASDTEGWPKAIAEGMAFGLVCIGSDCGLVPQMLSAGKGIVVPPRDVKALAKALHHVADSPLQYQPMRAQAAQWAQQYSLEGLRRELHKLVTRWWQAGPPVAEAAQPSRG